MALSRNEWMVLAGIGLFLVYEQKQVNAGTGNISTAPVVNCPGSPGCPGYSTTETSPLVDCPGGPNCPGSSTTDVLGTDDGGGSDASDDTGYDDDTYI